MGKGNTSSVCTCDLHVYIDIQSGFKIYKKYKFPGTKFLGQAVTGK